jgi:hypothetical protein
MPKIRHSLLKVIRKERIVGAKRESAQGSCRGEKETKQNEEKLLIKFLSIVQHSYM